MDHGNIIIYKDHNGLNNIEVKMVDNNVLLNQEQLVNLYNFQNTLNTFLKNMS